MSSQNKGSGENNKGKGALLGGAGILGLGLLKAKGLWLILLKLLGSLKFLYVFKSFLSMFLMIGLYTMTFGFFYAFVVVGLILIHEMGHYIFMKGMGLNPKLPMFVPFLGAYVEMQKMPGDQASHAWVAIAGPLVGGVTSVALYFAGFMLNSGALMAAGNTGVLLNLLQLVPAKPLDGGFIAIALSKWFLLLGVGISFTLFMAWHSPILILICLMACFSTYKAFKRLPEPDGRIEGEVPTTLPEKFLVGTAYFGLLGALSFVFWLSHNELYRLVRPNF